MLIDWFTFVAQVINFLILVWLLKRFLYHPILNAIAQREERIAAQAREAAERSAEAEKVRSEFRQKSEALNQERAALIGKASEEARAEGRRLLETARQEYNNLRSRLQASLREEQEGLSRDISEKARQEVLAIARQALASLADTSLEEQMARAFIRRLSELEGEEKERLASAFKPNGRPAVVRSAFNLPAAQKEAIEKALKDIFGAPVHAQFELRPELSGGIEFSMNGYKIAWSIDDYLGTLEKNISEILSNNDKPLPEDSLKPEAHGKND
ncbi:MAG: F0F1 ATP synthase subunit delta [Phaeodactylibacter sp.]|nr:F0F1 ATP synthase subunit delta [Phaeodactylibacter sp.]